MFFFSLVETYDNLISSGQIKGSLYGGRQEMSAVFVPEIYVKAQQQYVQSFFNQNGYVEYSSLKKIGVTEPDAYVHDLFKDKEIKYLSGSCFSSYKLSIMEEEIEDTLNGDGYCDLSVRICEFTFFLITKLKFFSEMSNKVKVKIEYW